MTWTQCVRYCGLFAASGAIPIVLIAYYTDCHFIPIVLFATCMPYWKHFKNWYITPGATIPARWQVGVHCPVWSLLWPLCCIVHYTYFASCVLYLWSLSYTYCATLKINKNLIVTSAPQYPLTGRCHLVDVRSGTQLTTSTTTADAVKKSFLIIFYSQHVGEVLVSLCVGCYKRHKYF